MANEILHYSAVTIRVVGSGNLDMVLKGFDDIDTKTLTPLAMSTILNKEPTRLVNFTSQRATLTGSVNVIDEWFKINNITIWLKPIYTSYPM